MSKVKTLKIDEETHAQLAIIKAQERVPTLDQAINRLLKRAAKNG